MVWGVGGVQIILMLGNEGFAKGMCALLWDPQEVRIGEGSSSSSRPDPLDPTWPTHCWDPLSRMFHLSHLLVPSHQYTNISSISYLPETISLNLHHPLATTPS